MRTAAALRYFGTRRKLIEAAGVSRQAVSIWVKKGIVPEKHAYRLHEKTRKRLSLNRADYAPARSLAYG